MFLAFVHSNRIDSTSRQIQAAFPDLWQRVIFPATEVERKRRPPHRPGVDLQRIRQELRSRNPAPRASVLFAVDIRPEVTEELSRDLIYHIPTLEVIPVQSRGNISTALRPHMEYFGLIGSQEPAHLSSALGLFAERFDDVDVLNRAFKSAENASDFREPRLAMISMHMLRRVVVDWSLAKRRDPKRVKHRLLQSPTRDALREIIADARFDLSDAAERARALRTWACTDGCQRYFGWHLKWSLAAPRGTANHCRIHYALERGSSDANDTLYIGHCGEHLK